MTKLYIDADIPAYQSSAAVEEVTDWGDDFYTLHSDLGDAKKAFTRIIDGWATRFDAEPVLVYSSDFNFRKTIYEQYKGNRKGTRKPIVYHPLVAWTKEKYDYEIYSDLEGDDTCGILGSEDPDGIVISIDKDMKTVKGITLFNPDHVVSEQIATYWHMCQTLTGDTTDGYPGCKGIGIKTANKILSEGLNWVNVFEAYDSKGYPSDDALVQGRVAKILDYKLFEAHKKGTPYGECWEPDWSINLPFPTEVLDV